MTVVRNLSGTSGTRAPGGATWEEYNRAETGSTRRTCVVNGCSREATVGAHVEPIHPLWPLYGMRPVGAPGIALMCHQHNHYTNTAPMRIDDRAKLAPLPQQAPLDVRLHELLGGLGPAPVTPLAPATSFGQLPSALRESMALKGLVEAQVSERGARGYGGWVAGLVAVAATVGLVYLGVTRERAQT